MVIKSETDINTSILTSIQSLRPDADISSGGLIADIVANAPATALSLSYLELQNISHAQSVAFASSLSDTQINELATNWGLTRKVATASQGYVTFFRRTSPPTTITINAGSTISTQNSSSNVTHSFKTLSLCSITSGSYNSLTGLYEATVAVESLATGTSENVAVNTITVSGGITGIDGCVNRLAFTSGTDAETNTQLALRIVTASQARLLGTAPGYQTLVDSISGVERSIIVTPGESDVIRQSTGGEVDVVVLGQDIASTTQVETFNSISGLCIYFDTTPVVSIASVVGVSNIFIEDTDFVFVPDTTSEYYGSNQSLDRLVWISGNKPADGTDYTINYSYNKLIGDVQTELDLPENKLLSSDVLVREASAVLVDISMSVAITSGVNSADAISQIETAIATYMETLSMGDSLEQSDLIYYLRTNLSFIDNIVVPFTNIARRGLTGVTDLSCSKFEYFTIDGTSLTIVVI